MNRKAAFGGLLFAALLSAVAVAVKQEPSVRAAPTRAADTHAVEKVETSSAVSRSAPPRNAPVATNLGGRGLPARTIEMGNGRFLSSPRPGPDGKAPANIPDLDEVLEADDSNDVWADRVMDHARKSVPAEAGIRELSVKCTQTFCRVKIVRPTVTEVGWHEIDEVFAGVAKGEAIFSTETVGDLSTGYLYFAEAHLPLSKPPLGRNVPEDPDGV